MKPIIQLQNIMHRYDKDLVIKDVNMELNQGEIVALIGPSGSGKSTIMNIIGGLIHPTDGACYLNGTTGHVSFMPQTHSLMPWRTVIQNIELASEIKANVSESNAISLLERAGFLSIKDKYPHELSGGMKQRVSFLRALNTTHQLLLLDEPFSALDEITRNDMQVWLKSLLSESDKTVLMITHSIDEAIKMSSRILVLNEKPATIIQSIDVSDQLTVAQSAQLKANIIQLLK
ncbi:ATP-binding cassette domain-containing protein [Macrococcus armenti]|uniref:ABC transporter ATP-binding protein n=1 Tax=Macrococcus armenti TaxID=2875764 RepID=UPI001CCA8ED8|nr:ATP-binding cassette domain-containing protein [Macrococcus armenti]UBH23328.1 ATP-binding cassette domain-containing protein [Macrococcus armenti]